MIPPPKHVMADSSRIISIYADGEKKVITSTAPTVAEALKESGVQLGSGDSVEPSPDTAVPVGFFNINVYRSRPVVVVDGAVRKTVQTSSQSPALIAKTAGFTVYPEDTYAVSTINEVTSAGVVGQQVVIDRAVPVTLLADGQKVTARTHQKTVGGLLNERDVAFGPEDTVTPGRDTKISPNISIQINRVKVAVVKQTEAIAHETKTVNDPNLEIGTTRVETAGSDGQKDSTYRVQYQNGVEKSRQLISQTVVKQPVTEVKIVGTKPKKNTLSADQWYRLRLCESGNNYGNKRNPNYRGAYQFDYGTWASVGGSGDPANASPAEQDMRAQILFERRGLSPWGCAWATR